MAKQNVIGKANILHILLLTVCVALLGYIAFLLAGCGTSAGSGAASDGQTDGQARDNTPQVQTAATPGTAVVSDSVATMDYSNTANGYFCVQSKLGSTPVKVLVNVGGTHYQDTLTDNSWETIPLSAGNGTYQVGVWRNVSGTKYASAFSQDLSVTLASETSPFLYPNQYVNFSQGDASMQAVTTITKNSKTDLDAINNIYQYVVDNISYDDHKAATVQPGYLPNNTSTLSTKTGICFDYASLTCAMLREERIPAKLVVGYAKQAYHSWIEVYSTKTGTVQKYSFNGKGWVLMDPTFDSTSKGTADVTALVGDGHSYQPIYYY